MKKIDLFILLFLFSFCLFSCSDQDIDVATTEGQSSETIPANKTSSREADRNIQNNHAPVMMQGFYWDVPAGGTWWDVVKSKVPAWSEAGITSIWLPPVSKAQNGALSMGYDPTDYFDLGEFDQNGSIETRFGSKDELTNLIDEAHNYNIEVYADIVINHNSGGQKEDNQYTGVPYWTKFDVASGKFTRSQHDFHPNYIHQNDPQVFGGFPDLCHHHFYVQEWLWKADYSFAKYLKDEIGFDGWRFDFVKGFEPWVVKDWLEHNGGFSVGELWDGNATYLEQWANEANSSAFDFACYYAMKEAFDGNDLNKLNNDMLLKRNPYKAVTFVANHDTNEIWNKNLAYAYILTHEGLPCLFYRDYEEWLDKDKLNNLIWIHDNLAGGSTSVLYTDNDEYIAKRNGWEDKAGLVVYINNSENWSERWVETNWSSARIKDFTGHSDWEPVTQSGRWVKIQCPPKSYSVWSIANN
ncbi:alpha-amylase [Aureibacter tunicatorum]|uniref:Alpha-amylase n=1 Tax=Aureibacter tunicatorum TaxID=866807 RepID=A0AAE3XP96_9BACT|nr:alpha-amylase [Aureibacter tunicatorum]MDR6239535.1 alpha-amylase [Aureibacter tunicatorum]BDD04012.1 alpha-amylase [Aureibacter tunicatorum]